MKPQIDSSFPTTPEQVIKQITMNVIRLTTDTMNSMTAEGFVSVPAKSGYSIFLYLNTFIQLMQDIHSDAKTLGRMAMFANQYNEAYVAIFAGEEFTISHTTGAVKHSVRFGVIDSVYKVISINVHTFDVQIGLKKYAHCYPEIFPDPEIMATKSTLVNYMTTHSDSWKTFLGNTPANTVIKANGKYCSRMDFLDVLCTEKLESLEISFGRYVYMYGVRNNPVSWNVLCNIDDDWNISGIIGNLIDEVRSLYNYDKYCKMQGVK